MRSYILICASPFHLENLLPMSKKPKICSLQKIAVSYDIYASSEQFKGRRKALCEYKEERMAK